MQALLMLAEGSLWENNPDHLMITAVSVLIGVVGWEVGRRFLPAKLKRKLDKSN